MEASPLGVVLTVLVILAGLCVAVAAWIYRDMGGGPDA